MKGWKKWVVVVLALLSVAASCVTLGNFLATKSNPDSGSIAYVGPTPVLKTDKTVYEHNEPIMVTAYGDGSDWIGIVPQKEDGTPDFSYGAIFWQYIMPNVGTGKTAGKGSGVAVNILEGSVGNGIPSDMSEDISGTYYIVLVPNDSLVKNYTEIVAITVK